MKTIEKIVSAAVIATCVLSACSKDVGTEASPSATNEIGKKAPLSVAEQSSASKPKNECRLVFATNTDPTGTQNFTFEYNAEGLASRWDIANYGLFEQEYDADGRLTRAINSVSGEVIFTVRFFYEGNDSKVSKETLYFGTSSDVMDEAYYTYNAQGKLVKVESLINDYVALTTYTPEGNVSSSNLFFSGSPVYSAFYTYDDQHKNPYRAVPGVDHAYPYYTPADLFYSKWQYTSLKQVAYDENGEPFVLFEYDPSKSVLQAFHQNYTSSATYFDLLSQTSFPYNYEYENCGPKTQNSVHRSGLSAGVRKADPMILLQRNPSKSFKQQVQDLRQQLK